MLNQKPMKSVYNLLTPVLLFLVLTGGLTPAIARTEFTKTIKKEYDIAATGTTMLSNKYGKVDIKTWDQNKVKIAVTIVVNASSESAAQNVFDRININFSNSSDYVKAETVVEPVNSRWGFSTGSRSDYSINYEVYMPASNNLQVDHRYGDLYVGAVRGKVRLDVKYVNFKLESAGDNSSITFGYGNGTIVKAKDLYTDVSYSKLNIEEAANLNITSKYTQVNVTKASDLTCTTKYDTYQLGKIQDLKNTGMYDNFKIGECAGLELIGKYTTLKAERVTKGLDLDMSYGSAEAKLAKGFSSAAATARYTNFKIGTEAGASYFLDAISNYAGISYPTELDVEYNIQKNASQTVKGKLGKSPAATIKVQLDYGGLKVYTY